MANVGLHTTYWALIGADGNVIKDDDGLSETGVFELDTRRDGGNLGTKTANITNLGGTITKISANNENVINSSPTSSPQVAFDIVSMNMVVRNKLLGYKKLSSGVWAPGGGQSPTVAVMIVTNQTADGGYMYYCFGRGTVTWASQNVQTNTDTAETFDDDTLTYYALANPNFNNKPVAINWESQAGFDRKAMFDAVFPGQELVQNNGTIPGGGLDTGGSTTGGTTSPSGSGSAAGATSGK